MISFRGSIRSTMSFGARRRTIRRWLVLPASLLVAVACSGDAADGPSTTRSSSEITETTPTDADVTKIIGVVIGSDTYPNYAVQAPPGWSTPDGHFVTSQTSSGVLGLSVWAVGMVPRNPCHWQGSMVDPGPTVHDLAAALAAQAMRNATTPTDVTLRSQDGLYIEWSVPTDMVVTGDADFKGCDVEPSNGHRDFVSWLGEEEGERYQQVAGQVDRLWILDVGGQRVLVDATYSPDTSEVDRDELDQIAASLRFTRRDA